MAGKSDCHSVEKEEEKKMRGLWMIRKGQASLAGKSGGALVEACGFYLVEDGTESREKNALLSLQSCLLLQKIPKCGKNDSQRMLKCFLELPRSLHRCTSPSQYF